MCREKETLITGATGQVGSKTLDFLLSENEIEIVAAVRSPQKAEAFTARGIATVILDLDDESTHLPALKGFNTRNILARVAVMTPRLRIGHGTG